MPGGLLPEPYNENVAGLAVEMLAERLPLNADGTVSPPAAPGLGMQIDSGLLGRYLVTPASV